MKFTCMRIKKSLLPVIMVVFVALPLFAQNDTTAGATNEAEASAAKAEGSDQAGGDALDLFGEPITDEMISQGETLYKNNCTVCHEINEVLVGPALKNVTERRPHEWLYKFIKNSQQVIQGGDEYAVELYNEYNQTEMPSFDFSNEEVDAILAYIKVESNKAPVEEQAAADDGAATGTTVTTGTGVSSEFLTIILVLILVILVILLVVLVLIVSLLTKFLKERQGASDEEKEEIESAKVNPLAFVKSKGFIALGIFIFTAIVLKSVIDSLFWVGVQQGYQPEQPIAFSHELHAGQYEIDCNYCHVGAYESKNAYIPSANICMNCHTAIKTESEQIQRIWAAVENDQPIEWVRIHNLPDLAYFNHAQHTTVGGIECQTCHGPIEEMEVVYQHSTLTMGWCIDCHRETEINFKDNGYYDKLVEVYAETDEAFTVEKIGGLECSKCHY